MSVLRKRDLGGAGASGGAPKRDGWFSKELPGLWEFLAVDSYPDGSSRRAGTLTLFFDDGACKGCLNDRDNCLVAFAAGDGLEAVLGAFEAGLQGDSLDWRKPSGGARKKR